MNKEAHPDDYVKLEFTGKHRGSVTYRVGRRSYRAGNNKSNRIVHVHPDDVAKLLAKRVFKKYEPPKEEVKTENTPNEPPKEDTPNGDN